MGRFVLVIPVVCLLVVASGCKSTDWEQKYLEKEQENRALQEAFDSQNTSLAENDATAEGMRRELEQTEAEVAALARELSKRESQPVAPAPVPVEDEAYQALLADYDRLQKQYGDLVRITEDGNLEITLESSVTFSSGSYNLTSQGKRTLESVAKELIKEFPNNAVRVIGHTDTDPIKKSPFKDNWELGSERAIEVVRYLAQQGVERTRMEPASRGEHSPIAENTTQDGKKKNRRVEIVVIMPKGRR
jgi:chemotaxis protein MotB